MAAYHKIRSAPDSAARYETAKRPDILEAAKRELLEESGYTADNFILWDAQQPISKIEWAVYTFIAKGLKKAADINLDAGEKIKLKPVSFEELLEIGSSENFYEKEVIFKFMEARLDEQKRAELKKLFEPQ